MKSNYTRDMIQLIIALIMLITFVMFQPSLAQARTFTVGFSNQDLTESAPITAPPQTLVLPVPISTAVSIELNKAVESITPHPETQPHDSQVGRCT